MTIKILSATALIALLLTGCSSGPATAYHALRAPSGLGSSQVVAENQPVIALRNLTLPGYLSDQDIVYLKGSNQIIYAQGQKWAEPLSENLRQVMVSELRNITDNPAILAYPLGSNIRPKQIIDVQISDFVAQKERGILQLRSTWQTTDTSRRKQTSPPGYQFNRDYPLQDSSIDSIIQAYQKGVSELTAAIAATLN